MSLVSVITSTRADWGLLRPFADALAEEGVRVEVVVTGTHLSEDFGMTGGEVEASGFDIDARIPILAKGDGPAAEALTMANALQGFAAYFSQKTPDAVLLLGDRYEMLAIAEAAFLFRIPIVHVHGGEKTIGAIDDCLRHCITKLSSVHLACTKEYTNRIIQVGELPAHVYNVGAVGVENALALPQMDSDELFASLGIDPVNDYLLFTYHPVTAGGSDPLNEMSVVLDALAEVEMAVIATKANADAGGFAINELLDAYARRRDSFHLFPSLGSVRYMNALRNATAVVGNSSSGILEAPALGIPTVNIGPRQDGRIRSDSVIDCAVDKDEIVAAIEKARSRNFREAARKQVSKFGNGDVSRPSARIIKRYLEHGFPSVKEFYDIPREDDRS